MQAPKPSQGRIARADLLQLLAAKPQAPATLLWEPPTAPQTEFGYHLSTLDIEPIELTLDFGLPQSSSPINPAQTTSQLSLPPRLSKLWVMAERQVLSATPARPVLQPAAPLTEATAGPLAQAPALTSQTLLPKARLLPALLSYLAQQRPAGLALEPLIEQIAQRRLPSVLPRKTSRRWPTPLIVLLDFDSSLTPYHSDIHRVCRWLLASCGAAQVSLRVVDNLPGGNWRDWLAIQQHQTLPAAKPWAWPAPGSTVFVLSDLGLFSPPSTIRQSSWLACGRQLRQRNCQVLALAPVATETIPQTLARYFQILRWSPDAPMRTVSGVTTAIAPAQLTGLDELLAMFYYLRRVDPSLLRALRRLHSSAPDHAALEGAAWNHPDIQDGNACRLSDELTPEQRQHYLSVYQANAHWHNRLRTLSSDAHSHFRAGLRHEESLRYFASLPQPSQLNQTQQQLQTDARAFFQSLLGSLQQAQDEKFPVWLRYAHYLVQTIDPDTYQAQADLFNQLTLKLSQYDTNLTLPDWFDPALQQSLNPLSKSHRYWLVQTSRKQLLLQPEPAQPKQSLLAGPLDFARIQLRSEQTPPSSLALSGQSLVLENLPSEQFELLTEHERLLFQQIPPPHTALECGCDRQGAYALLPMFNAEPRRCTLPLTKDSTGLPLVIASGRSLGVSDWYTYFNNPIADVNIVQDIDNIGTYLDLQINEVSQRLRYIPPGHFLMGSPDDEPGRVTAEELQQYDVLRAEGPQHPVYLSEGFWLADTACTQAFWQAVMGNNPSHFKDTPNNPVEQVSWQDVQAFLKKLQQLTGLAVSLPTEAQWEYACRAGTSTPFWWGNHLSTVRANYDGNFPYHQGEKGPFRERTMPVDFFQANPWGLWQMQGNVWEWCLDGLRDYSTELAIDPLGPHDSEDYRALRGGSWFDGGGSVRSAYSSHLHPGSRRDYIGFRWLLSSPSTGRAEPT